MPFINAQGQVIDVPEHTAIELEQFDELPAEVAPALAMPFESAVDGRAFSAAALYRSEGYQGQLIGTGEIGLDRLAYGFRSGFDVLWISSEELALLTEQHLAPFPSAYQLAIGG